MDARGPARPAVFALACATSLIAFASATGCARKPQVAPLRPPAVEVAASHFAGTALSGPRPAAGALTGAPAIRIDVEWVALRELPSELRGFSPVGAEARLVLATRDRQPVLSTSRLTADARWSSGEPAEAFVAALRSGKLGETASVASRSTAIPPGTTLLLRVDAGGGAEGDTIELFAQHLPAGAAGAAQVTGALEPAVAVQRLEVPQKDAPPAMNAPAESKLSRKAKRRTTPVSPPAAAAAPAASPPALSRELAVLRPLDLSTGPVSAVLVLPLAAGGSPAKGMAVLIRAAPAADDPETQQMLAAALADVRRAGDAAVGRATGSAAPAEWPGYESALAALDRADARRRALVYLAAQTNARLAEDVALVADDATLQQLAADVRARAATATPPFSSDALGGMLDRACLEWAARLAGENRLPPEISAVLTAYAGEAGRRPASLEELARAGAAGPRAALETRLVSENLIYLDDSSPAARVRALDWLAARGRAPAGYDPLAPPRQRRLALERALEQQQQQRPASAAPATQPIGP